ncbi:hypothetical protein BGZ61DRAFT_445627 [Ilyonectria robusta]|uniref:uncharacterized protein n=1 Tax=Ilyonectria robusta TaxID=1079257 RepID=UPI001E8CFB4C|nr:uncharacterized protein BGZ61DRAFT_445627 [Ilyonectria robusta]KAH8733970.1 hypothetical protein BGZ61DRAFT_445627 [Ilyonectria robusta]
MDRIKAFFNSHWFDAHHKTRVHIGQIVLVILIIGLSGARVATKPSGIPTSRSDTIAITMSVKTLVILTYQLVTEHVSNFKKWGSLKAYAILNTLEILFWFVVVILAFMGISTFCQGTNCAMIWLVALVGFLLTAAAFWTSVASWLNFRYFKNYGIHRGSSLPRQRPQDPYRMDDSSISNQSQMK